MTTWARNIDHTRHRGSTNLVFADGHVCSTRLLRDAGTGNGGPWKRSTTWTDGRPWIAR